MVEGMYAAFMRSIGAPSLRACRRTIKGVALDAEKRQTVAIPVFPLRKTVRLPTETLTLNLYEERYIALAEYVLKQPKERRMFGAIYASNKPQIVGEGGKGPIVPILEEGDVGVVFLVQHSEEGLINTLGSEPRRRIRLVGVGALRFVILKILQNGYKQSQAGGQVGTSNLPFIMAEAAMPVDGAPRFDGPEDLQTADIERLVSLTERAFVDLGAEKKLLRSDLASFAVVASRLGDDDIAGRLDALLPFGS